MRFEESVRCEVCGFGYVKPIDNRIHNEYHRKWKDLCREYGLVRTYEQREKAKHELRERLFELRDAFESTRSQSKRKSILREMMDVQEDLYRVYYERSVSCWHLGLMSSCHKKEEKHCTYAEYVSLLLGQDSWNDIVFKEEVLNMLVAKYGKRNGMTGSYYEGRLMAA